MAREYVRTDKNGTKIYHDYTCTKCGGMGGWDGWPGWTCYKCGGSGKQMNPEVYKEYTPEYRAILDARNAKRREKEMTKAQAEKGERQAAWKQSKGFVNDRIHLVSIENSFELKDEIKAAGGWYNDCTGYYDTQYGTTWVHNFKDAAGNVLVWKTSSCSGFEKDQLRIKGTIKAHDEYNGVKQTVLTRCKIA